MDLQSFLNACGEVYQGLANSPFTGGEADASSTDAPIPAMPDRIAAATYLCAAALPGHVFLRRAREEHLSTVTAVLREAGCHPRR